MQNQTTSSQLANNAFSALCDGEWHLFMSFGALLSSQSKSILREGTPQRIRLRWQGP